MRSMSKANQTRQRVIDTATRLFLERGVEATSIADICRVSGVSNGSVFHHFGAKDAIALEVYLAARAQFWEAVIGAMEREDDALDGIEACVRAQLRYQTEHPAEHAYFLAAGDSSWMRAGAERVRAMNETYRMRAAAWALPHIQAGRLPLVQGDVFGALLFGTPYWIARTRQLGLRDTDPVAIADDLVRVLRRALAGA